MLSGLFARRLKGSLSIYVHRRNASVRHIHTDRRIKCAVRLLRWHNDQRGNNKRQDGQKVTGVAERKVMLPI